MQKEKRIIKSARGEYTGGNIWLFFGSLDDGNYFLVTDDGDTLIFNADPENAVDSDVVEWDDFVSEHLVEELYEKERARFNKQLCNVLLELDVRERGWIFDSEILAYKKYWSKSS